MFRTESDRTKKDKDTFVNFVPLAHSGIERLHRKYRYKEKSPTSQDSIAKAEAEKEDLYLESSPGPQLP